MTQSLYLERSLVWHINLTSVRNTSKAETGWGLQVSTTEHGKLNRGWRRASKGQRKKSVFICFPPFFLLPTSSETLALFVTFLGVYIHGCLCAAAHTGVYMCSAHVYVCVCAHRCVCLCIGVRCALICTCVRHAGGSVLRPVAGRNGSGLETSISNKARDT